jgi:hypothetical protein
MVIAIDPDYDRTGDIHWRTHMRLRLTPILTVGTAAVALLWSQAAGAQMGPWCAHYAAGLGGMSCRFPSYVECVTDLRGIGGWCERNMFYVEPEAAAKPRARSGKRAQKRPSRPRD